MISNRLTTAIVIMTLVMLVTGPAYTYSSEQFVQEVRTKFRTTSNIYLEAVSTRTVESNNSQADTSKLILAYEYPRKFLQSLVGKKGNSQHLIVKGDRYVLRYPHLDFQQRRKLSRSNVVELLKEHVPMAGVLLGIKEGDLPAESLSTNVDDSIVTVEATNDDPRLPFKKFTGTFERHSLIPKSFYIQGKYTFRIDVTTYREEKRFPGFVEKAFAEMNTKWLERSNS